MSNEVIAQAREPDLHEELTGDLPNVLTLTLHGVKFNVQRDLFFALPENILICLSMGAPPQAAQDDGYTFYPESKTDGSIHIDFNPRCFGYTLEKISELSEGLEPVDVMQYKAAPNGGDVRAAKSHTSTDGESVYEVSQLDELPWLPLDPAEVPLVLRERPSCIVLKENLEFYVFNKTEMSIEELNKVKNEVGHMFESTGDNKLIFHGLRDAGDMKSPEYYLMQMLVQAGMEPSQKWDFREREENTARVLSMQLAKVNVPEEGMHEQIYACHKLLLFWRKPAKKCWWDKLEMEVFGKPLVVHCRRVWTLELDIIGLKHD